jgi:hypothetical protein
MTSDAKPPQVILTDLSNTDRSVSAKPNARTASTRNIPLPLPGPFFSKKHLSVEVPRDQHSHNHSSHPENLSKRKTAPPNFIPNGFQWESIRENVPPTPSNSFGAGLPEEIEPSTQSEKKSANSCALNIPSDGEILELEEQFSELCVMYDSLFGFKDEKKNNPSQVCDNLENKYSSFSSHHLSDDFSALESPSRLKKKKTFRSSC